MIHVAVLEDSTLVRKGIVAMINNLSEQSIQIHAPGLEPHQYQVISDVKSPKEIFDTLVAHKIDLLLMDYSLNVAAEDEALHPMHTKDGHALIRRLHKDYPDLKILVISAHISPMIARMSLEAGANGFITKDTTDTDLHQAIEAVLRGDIYVENRFLSGLLKNNQTFNSISLTPKEVEVLRLIANGQRLTNIANTLSLSIKTVSAHKLRAMEKLHASSDMELFEVLKEMHL